MGTDMDICLKDVDSDKLKETIHKEIVIMFTKILDFCEVCHKPDGTFPVLRSKILKTSNECIRNVKHTIDSFHGKEQVLEELIYFNQTDRRKTNG